MNKNKMLEALDEGCMVRHNNFTDSEWMFAEGCILTFEDGCSCTIEEFFLYRTEESWEEGWEIVGHIGFPVQQKITYIASSSRGIIISRRVRGREVDHLLFDDSECFIGSPITKNKQEKYKEPKHNYKFWHKGYK